MHKKIKEKLLHGIEIAESKTIGEYWEDIKEIVISLDLNEQNDVEDFGIMFEVFNPEDFWECYFTIQWHCKKMVSIPIWSIYSFLVEFRLNMGPN